MTIRVETLIRAAPEACFDAHRDMGLHTRSAASTGETIVAGRSEGLLELGEEVTFEARHFGLHFRMTSKVVVLERPHRFVDAMRAGPFRRMRHLHEFAAERDGTRIVDTLDFASPLGPLAWLADRLFVGPHLRRFLSRRNAFLRSVLEIREPSPPTPSPF